MVTANNSVRFGESFAVEVVVLGRLFIAKSRAKCDRRRDYDRRCRSFSRRAATLLSQTKEVPCSPLLRVPSCRSNRSRMAPAPGTREVAAALIPSPITHPGVCDSCFVVVALHRRRRNRVAVP